jgi:NAD(P)-dependent dehydrogenase (short-subunit alcohol dehydrogenase family)
MPAATSERSRCAPQFREWPASWSLTSPHSARRVQSRRLRKASRRTTRIHNAGVGGAEKRRVTDDGFEHILQVNVLAPYLLTCLISALAGLPDLGPAAQGRAHLDDLQFERRPWNGRQADSDSKLWDVVLAFAVARHWPRT